MTLQPFITTATSHAQREAAERVGLPCFAEAFADFLVLAQAFQDQDDIDGAALEAGLAAIRARAGAGFDAGTYIELQGTRGSGSPNRWEDVLPAGLTTHIGLEDESAPWDLETALRLGLANGQT